MFCHLPIEIWQLILNLTDFKSRIILRQTCKMFYSKLEIWEATSHIETIYLLIFHFYIQFFCSFSLYFLNPFNFAVYTFNICKTSSTNSSFGSLLLSFLSS